MVSHTVEEPARRAVRHQSDVVRAVLGATALVGATVLARRGEPGLVEVNLFRLVNELPGFVGSPLLGVMQLGSLGAVPVIALVAVLGRRRRLARLVLMGGTGAWALARLLQAQLSQATAGLASTVEDLQEISRGIHPAILSKGGLGPALRTLARRSVVPVEIEISANGRLPERVEVTAYYVVSEALTNVAKHAQASVAHVEVEAGDGLVRLSIRDDGIGGAEFGQGSGLIGVKDRVEALLGRIELVSTPGGGTSVLVSIPIDPG